VSANRKIRVLVAKPGLDGHDRGAKVVARALRDAGMEVVYTGIHQTPEMIADAAAREEVDVVGLSILSGAHLEMVTQVVRCLSDKGMGRVMVLVGGIIPEEDHPRLLDIGVSAIFGPGTPTGDIVRTIRTALGRR